MVKPAFKLVVFILPIFFVIGILRRYFGSGQFLPDPEVLYAQFSNFPSIEDEIEAIRPYAYGGFQRWTDSYGDFSTAWNGVKDLTSFFYAIGQTFKMMGQFFVGFWQMAIFLTGMVAAVITYPIQAVLYCLVIVGFGDNLLATA